MNETRTRDSRAFATVAAVVLIGLAAMAFVGMATLARHDHFRTRRAAADVQLRQLLLAGQAAADARLATGAAPVAGEVNVGLPAALAESGGRLTVEILKDASSDALSVEVLAAVEGWAASQTLSYARDGSRWRLVGAELFPARRRESQSRQ